MRSKFEEKIMRKMATVHRKAEELRAAAKCHLSTLRVRLRLARRESDVMFFRHEAGSRLVFYAGRVKNGEKDFLPLWGMHMMHLRELKLEEGKSLRDRIMKMMACMNEIEYINTNFDRNLAVD